MIKTINVYSSLTQQKLYINKSLYRSYKITKDYL